MLGALAKLLWARQERRQAATGSWDVHYSFKNSSFELSCSRAQTTAQEAYTGVPHFSKAHPMPLRSYDFTKEGHWQLFLLTKRNLKRSSPFTVKSENSLLRLFCSELSWRQLAPSAARGAPPSSSPGTTLSISASAAIALNWVREHLCFISIYFVHLLARCVLRYMLLHFTPFQLIKGFIRTLYFQTARKTCTGCLLQHCNFKKKSDIINTELLSKVWYIQYS